MAKRCLRTQRPNASRAVADPIPLWREMGHHAALGLAASAGPGTLTLLRW